MGAKSRHRKGVHLHTTCSKMGYCWVALSKCSLLQHKSTLEKWYSFLRKHLLTQGNKYQTQFWTATCWHIIQVCSEACWSSFCCWKAAKRTPYMNSLSPWRCTVPPQGSACSEQGSISLLQTITSPHLIWSGRPSKTAGGFRDSLALEWLILTIW